jgi:hypothetical protein
MSTKKSNSVPVEVVRSEPQQAASQEATTAYADYAEDAGEGLSGHKVSDYKIPFLTIIQALSPQVQEGQPKYNPDAKQGMVVNTVTGELFDCRASAVASGHGKPLQVVVLERVTEYIEWRPRQQGRQGLVTVHKSESILRETTKQAVGQNGAVKDVLPNGNTVETTSKYFVLFLTKDGQFPAVIAMTGSNLKHSRSWLTKIGTQRGRRADGSTFPLPIYARIWNLITRPETNDKGTYQIWEANEGPLVPAKSNEYAEAKQIRNQVVEGQLALPDHEPEEDSDKSIPF